MADLVGLTQAVYASHLALLVGVAEYTDWRPIAGDAHDKVLATVLDNVLA